jgi:hypothetical protein
MSNFSLHLFFKVKQPKRWGVGGLGILEVGDDWTYLVIYGTTVMFMKSGFPNTCLHSMLNFSLLFSGLKMSFVKLPRKYASRGHHSGHSAKKKKRPGWDVRNIIE